MRQVLRKLQFNPDEYTWPQRFEFAKQGKYLETLVHDERSEVREIIALRGHHLDILVHDKDMHVRIAVAQHGYGLDILVNDCAVRVRKVVACYPEYARLLQTDKSGPVRNRAHLTLSIYKKSIKKGA